MMDINVYTHTHKRMMYLFICVRGVVNERKFTRAFYQTSNGCQKVEVDNMKRR